MRSFAPQVARRERVRALHDFIKRTLGHHLAAEAPGARPQVDDMIGVAHGLFVVLDDDHGVAEVAQPLEGAEQAIVVALVQPDARLVEDVEHAHQTGADLGRQPDALGLAAGERAGRTAEGEVLQADITQERQPLDHFLEDRPGDIRINRTGLGPTDREST